MVCLALQQFIPTYLLLLYILYVILYLHHHSVHVYKCYVYAVATRKHNRQCLC